MEPNRSNPHGANQYHLDPRQKFCWDSYVNPKSETFGNAYQSAMKAGYEEETAKQITVSNWFLEKTRRLNMLGKAERVLDKTLEESYVIDKEGNLNPSLAKIQQDSAKFLAERLGKSEGYSNRTELTGADGKDLPTPILQGVITESNDELRTS